MNECVSVIIPVHNRASMLARAIDSVLSQTYPDIEIIIVDDGSTDNVGEVLSRYTKRRPIYIREDRCKGAAHARNVGLRYASGDFVAFLDSDDEWIPKKLEVQMQLLKGGGSDLGIVYSGWRWIDQANGRTLQEIYPISEGNLEEPLLFGDCVGSFSTPLIKKTILLEVGGVDESLPARQDWDLWLRLSRVCSFRYASEILVNYYVHPSSISALYGNKIIGTEMVLTKHQKHFSQIPESLRGHYLLLSILYILNGDRAAARRNIKGAFEAGPKTPSVIRKTILHYFISVLPMVGSRWYFRLMRVLNKDFYWIVSQ